MRWRLIKNGAWPRLAAILGALAGVACCRADTIDLAITNGPAVFWLQQKFHTNIYPDPTRPPFNKPEFDKYRKITLTPYTNKVFSHFAPNSLHYQIWTNVLARTNGLSTLIWKTRARSERWPETPPVATWNTNCVMWGMRGLTALSFSWEREGSPGQVPIIALTGRHGYARGHGMGEEGIQTNGFAGKRVWFLTPNNEVIETTIKRAAVRVRQTSKPPRDYTVLIFDRDLPPGIQPLRVAAYEKVSSLYTNIPSAPYPMMMTEQTGNVSLNLPGFTVETMKGGDSGSPNLLPLGNELVFISGRTTSGPSPEMQADMDELCRLEELNPADYQMQWVDFSAFPAF